MVRAIWFLRNFDLLKHMSEQDMLSFERLTSMVYVEKGETVFLPADPADCVYLLKKGMVEIAQVSGAGKQLALSVVGPGEVFGALALVSERPERMHGKGAPKFARVRRTQEFIGRFFKNAS